MIRQLERKELVLVDGGAKEENIYSHAYDASADAKNNFMVSAIKTAASLVIPTVICAAMSAAVSYTHSRFGSLNSAAHRYTPRTALAMQAAMFLYAAGYLLFNAVTAAS